jgi:hypothetical protein
MIVDVCGDYESENGVTQEFQTFIVWATSIFVGVRPVSESKFEKLWLDIHAKGFA